MQCGRWHGAPPPRLGFQRHHLIPVALARRPQMAEMFGELVAEGFALQNFRANGVVLPASERAALQSGHALHRGPHHGYSDVVAARVERIRSHFARQAPNELRAARRTAVMRLRLLQDTTRRALTDGHGSGLWLNRHDPMRLFEDRPYLDDAIERLFGGGQAETMIACGR